MASEVKDVLGAASGQETCISGPVAIVARGIVFVGHVLLVLAQDTGQALVGRVLRSGIDAVRINKYARVML
jgi:hypothetical protein